MLGVRVMMSNATFNNISVILHCGGMIYWWGKLEKTTDMSQVADKLYNIILVSSTPRLNGIRTPDVSGDRHGLHRNYHPNMTRTALI
jgi:hypothetical protein